MALNVIYIKNNRQPPENINSEQNLWETFKLGNKAAYATIYENHIDALYDYGRKIVDNPVWVEDCIHDLFVRRWQNKDNLGRPQSTGGYLLSSLRRTIFRKIKKERKFIALPDDSFAIKGLWEIDGDHRQSDNPESKEYQSVRLLRKSRRLDLVTTTRFRKSWINSNM